MIAAVQRDQRSSRIGTTPRISANFSHVKPVDTLGEFSKTKTTPGS